MLVGGAGLLLAIVAIVLARPVAQLFVGYNADLTELTSHAFCVFAVSYALLGYNIFASGLFTAMNNGLISAVISFLRTFVFQVAAVLMLPLWFGTDGVWLAASAAEIGALLFSVLFIRRFRHRYGYL